jgi:O-acetylhomoserine (thiol)-lyase
MERSGHVYSRISNPTNAVLEERVAALEAASAHRHRQRPGGAAPGHLHAGGRGSHIVASSALYGGSHNLLHYTLAASASRPPSSSPATSTAGAPRSARTPAAVRRDARQPRPRRARHPDRRAIAHEHGLPLLVDSTFTTPYLMKPFEHRRRPRLPLGDQVPVRPRHRDRRRAGRRRQLRLGRSGRFPELTAPYDGFHGMVFSEESTVGAFLLRARREGLRDFGACMSPHTAWLILQGIETLAAAACSGTSTTRAAWSRFPPSIRWGEASATPASRRHPSHAARRGPCCHVAAARCTAST